MPSHLGHTFIHIYRKVGTFSEKHPDSFPKTSRHFSKNLPTFFQKPRDFFLSFLPCDNQRDTCQDGGDADGKLESETLAEDEYTDDDGGDWFQGSHDGGWRTADEIDGDGHEEEGEYRWQQCQLQATEPLFRCLEKLETLARYGCENHYREESEDQYPKGELHVRHRGVPSVY